MSVIVMGIEMPENCHVCGLCFGGLCFAIPPEVDVMCPDEGRPNWCPIRPLPEKHGRLGDLDELKTSFADSINECKKWIKELEENGDNETLPLANQAFCTFVEAALRLKSIPTIVEAEGE